MSDRKGSQCALYGQGVDREPWRRPFGDWDIEILCPAYALGVDPLVLVLDISGQYVHTWQLAYCEPLGILHSLLIEIGAVLPHAFIKPPRNMGTYLISHCLKAGECYSCVLTKREAYWMLCRYRQVCLSKPGVASRVAAYLQDIESKVSKG